MLLSLSHLGSLMARTMTAIARSATATEFIGTESVRDQATTERSQASEEDNVTGAVEEDTQSAGWAIQVCHHFDAIQLNTSIDSG